MSMGTRIRQAREAKGRTQAELAARVGLSVTTLSKLERDRLDPRVQAVQALATALGCSVPFLLYGRRGPLERVCDRWPVLAPPKLSGVISKDIDIPQTTYSEDEENTS